MIKSYLTAIAGWPVMLVVIGLSTGVVPYMRRSVPGVVLIALFMLVTVAS